MSNPCVLIDSNILKEINGAAAFASHMKEFGISNIYINNNKLFTPGNSSIQNIIAANDLLSSINYIKKPGVNDIKPAATIPPAELKVYLDKCSELETEYDRSKASNFRVSFDSWINGSSPNFPMSEKAKTLMNELDGLHQQIQSSSKREIITGEEKPTSWVVYSQNAGGPQFDNKNVKVTPITVESMYKVGGNTGAYKPALKSHMNNNEQEHSQIMECINNIKKKVDSISDHYKSTRKLMGGNKHEKEITELKQNIQTILKDAKVPPNKKLEAMLTLLAHEYSPPAKSTSAKPSSPSISRKLGVFGARALSQEDAINKKQNDHHYKRFIGLTLKDTLADLGNLNIKKPDTAMIARVNSIERPNTAQYSEFKESTVQRTRSNSKS